MELPAKILLVDDDPVLQELLGLIFQVHGYAVEQASDGDQAKLWLSEHYADLIVLDLLMPVLDGLRLLEWLRKEQKLATPVLCLTAMERPQAQQEILAAGATAVIFKPVDSARLLAKVRELLA